VQQCIANGKVVVQMEGLYLSSLEHVEATDKKKPHTTARLTWGPHIDFLDASALIKPSIPRHLYAPLLGHLARLSLVYSHRQIKGAQTILAHMQKYRAWIDRQVHSISSSENSHITALDDDSIMSRIGQLVQQLSGTPVAACADAVRKVVTNISTLFSG
jgi:hypothetical protein